MPAIVQALEDRVLLASAPAGYTLAIAGSSGSTFARIGQMAFHPDDPTQLYTVQGDVGNANGRVMRYDYDLATGTLSNATQVFSVGGIGDGIPTPLGLAFHGDDLWISRFEGFTPVATRTGTLTRLRDTNDDGLFDTHADFITGLSLGTHTINQIQIQNGSLYVGIGTQTNGGDPADEEVYNGTIVRIPDLANAVSTDLSDATFLAGDFLDTSMVDGRVHLFADGFRNPYGIRFDENGIFWVSDNGADGALLTADLIYKNVQAGDRGKFPPPGQPGGGSHTIEPFAEIGNNTGAGGFAMITTGPDAGDVLIAMTAGNNGRSVAKLSEDGTDFNLDFIDFRFDSPPGTPIDVLADNRGRLLIADYNTATIHALTPTAPEAVYHGDLSNPNRSGIEVLSLTAGPAFTVGLVTSLNLFNHTTGQSVDLTNASLVDNGDSSVSLDLSSLTLDDGRYTLEIPATAVTPSLPQTRTIEFRIVSGDVDGNGFVNGDDFFAVDANFNTSGSPFLPGDADGNGFVNGDDFFTVDANFNGSVAALELDFGDADEAGTSFPTTLANDGARHVITGNSLFLGTARDAEANGQPNADATGDNTDGTDDETGVNFIDPLEIGNTNVHIDITANVPGGAAVLNGWIDFNRDGDWDDPGEQLWADVAMADGVNHFFMTIPAGATAGTAMARFRLTETAGYSYHGLAPNGEVEDYQVTLVDPPAAAVAQSAASPGDTIPAGTSSVPQPRFLERHRRRFPTILTDNPIERTSLMTTGEIPAQLLFLAVVPTNGQPDWGEKPFLSRNEFSL